MQPRAVDQAVSAVLAAGRLQHDDAGIVPQADQPAAADDFATSPLNDLRQAPADPAEVDDPGFRNVNRLDARGVGFEFLQPAGVDDLAPDTILPAALIEAFEPGHLTLEEDTVTLGVLKSGEISSLAFLFDPQICQGTQIDGNLTYLNPKGELKRVEMKRRHADVVCPIFFTREHANTAMLRRLIKTELHETDLRVFRYPDVLEPLEVLGVDKFADSAVVVRARIKTQPLRQWATGREFNRRIKKAFDAAGIEIPFPHRTVYWGTAKDGTPATLHMMQGQKP